MVLFKKILALTATFLSIHSAIFGMEIPNSCTSTSSEQTISMAEFKALLESSLVRAIVSLETSGQLSHISSVVSKIQNRIKNIFESPSEDLTEKDIIQQSQINLIILFGFYKKLDHILKCEECLSFYHAVYCNKIQKPEDISLSIIIHSMEQIKAICSNSVLESIDHTPLEIIQNQTISIITSRNAIIDDIKKYCKTNPVLNKEYEALCKGQTNQISYELQAAMIRIIENCFNKHDNDELSLIYKFSVPNPEMCFMILSTTLSTFGNLDLYHLFL